MNHTLHQFKLLYTPSLLTHILYFSSVIASQSSTIYSLAGPRIRDNIILLSDWFAGIPAKCDNSLVGMCPGLPLSAAEGEAKTYASLPHPQSAILRDFSVY